MERRRRGRTGILKPILIMALVIASGIGGYAVYGAHKLDQLASMTFEDMLAYTTKDNAGALITVGILQNDKMEYKVYGENGIKLLREEHIYEIGSITKTFTTSLLCKAISEGQLNLDDRIDQHLQLTKLDYYPTIRRLVTHTSGYKGYYFETPMISNWLGKENVYRGISQDTLLKRLEKISVNDADYAFRYSNFGIATLGLVLERVFDQDYTALMNDYISKDLGLTNTRVSDGHGDSNHWKWSASDAYIPAGALLSNITDMMQYLRIQMNEQLDYLPLAHRALAEVNATTSTYRKMEIRMDSVGAAWMIDNEHQIIWHNGGTGNYNSYIGFDEEKRIGVVVLSNLPPNYRIPATVMGVEILTSLQK